MTVTDVSDAKAKKARSPPACSQVIQTNNGIVNILQVGGSFQLHPKVKNAAPAKEKPAAVVVVEKAKPAVKPKGKVAPEPNSQAVAAKANKAKKARSPPACSQVIQTNNGIVNIFQVGGSFQLHPVADEKAKPAVKPKGKVAPEPNSQAVAAKAKKVPEKVKNAAVPKPTAKAAVPKPTAKAA